MTAPTITAVREALAAALDGTGGVRASATVPGQVNPPVLLIRPTRGVFVGYQQAMGADGAGAAVDYTMDCVLLVSFADNDASQDQIDAFLSPEGPASLPAALLADPTLRGIASYAYIDRATGYGSMDYAGVTYLGCTLIAIVGAP